MYQELWEVTAVFNFKGHGDIPKPSHGPNAVDLKVWSLDQQQQWRLETCLKTAPPLPRPTEPKALEAGPSNLGLTSV